MAIIKSKKDKIIEQLSQEVEERSIQIGNLESKIEEKSIQIGNLESEIEINNKKIKNLTKGRRVKYTRKNVCATEDNILQINAFSTRLDAICKKFASVEYGIQRVINDEINEEDFNDRLRYINDQANILEDATQFKENVCRNMLLEGIAYIEKVVKDGDLIGLRLLNHNKIFNIQPTYDEYGYTDGFEFTYHMDNDTEREIQSYNLITVPFRTQKNKPYLGKHILEDNRLLFDTILNEETQHLNVIKKTSCINGLVTAPKEYFTQRKEDDLQAVQNSFEKHKGVDGETVVYLPDDITYQSIKPTLKDSLILESRFATESRLDALLNIPNGYFTDTTSNRVELNKDFVRRTITPITQAFKSALNKDLLLEEEKVQRYYFEVNALEFSALEPKEQMEIAKVGVEGGILTLDEAREIANKHKLSGIGNYLASDLGKVYVDIETNRFIIPNIGEGVNNNEYE